MGRVRAAPTVPCMITKKVNPTLIAVSGKKGAGKDTIAPLVAALYPNRVPVHMLCADPLKDKVDVLIRLVREADTRASAGAAFKDVDPDMPDDVCERMLDALYDAVKATPNEHARSHSLAVVRAQQIYGTDFRRALDPDYWTKLAVAAARQEIEAGNFPYFTDVRFPNEVEALASIGGLTIRLEVSPAEQARRLKQRDGRVPEPGELVHGSETALDGYDKFDIRVCTDAGVDATMAEIRSRV